ncbi:MULTISPECIES: hypothetical protein [unclassified Bacillus (in: firmicutes)]|uniref:hypothetical protein n=1 Tax=unclassified Bacillus (in: firmicutes) TaxID=185979 RepID=UPI000D028B79|nr:MULTISPECIES: hypothetical protein [unclassified Bacillus (in: firmicutes)]PRR90366.1 hypothetical protein C6W21_11595 [Bacillus sp. NMCN1]PRR98143.1 hypothetical protein C6W20_11225 [Bacillus sp. NMCN6]
MITRYINILKIHLIMRVEKDYSFFVRVIPFLKRIKNITIFKMIISTIFSTVLAFFLYWKYYSFVERWNGIFLLSIFILLFFLALINGILTYRRTHFSIYQDLLSTSPLSHRQIYVLLLTEELLWFVTQSWNIIITSFICLFFILKIPFSLFVLLISNLILIIFLLFIISNRLMGKYQLYKIKNKIGLFRFVIYMIFSCGLMSFGFMISHQFAKLILALREPFENIEQLLEDTYWLSVKDIFIQEFSADFINLKMIDERIYGGITYSINLPFLLLVLLALSMCIIFITSNLYPNYNNSDRIKSKQEFFDWFTIYTKIVSKVFRTDKSFLFKKELINLERKRWIVSPGVFSIIIYSLESFFYCGILIGIVKNTDDSSLIMAMLILFNVLTMIIHCFEVSYEYPQVFFLGSEGKSIDLLKTSPNGVMGLFESKLKLLEVILFIPLIINMVISLIVINSVKELNLSSFLQIIILLFTLYKISPLIQLYMAPLFSKFSFDDIQEVGSTYDEKELHIKSQSLPRNFIVVPLLIFSFINIFIPIYKWINHIELYYFIYFMLTIVVFKFISKKIVKKGIEKLERGKF